MLKYVRQDGVEILHDGDQVWLLDVRADGVALRRYENGDLVESYPPVSQAEATVRVAAIIQGFQPPRRLSRLDIPSDRIRSEPDSATSA